MPLRAFLWRIRRAAGAALVGSVVVGAALPLDAEPIRNITIDGNFSDWATVPSHTDPVDDQHDTDHSGLFDTPAHVVHPDVDVLEFKFAHDAENLYAYFRARGVIGRTQSHTAGTAGRYYVIVTIDIDNSDTTGYWLHEGGYYPTTRGYDMNMELEFYDGSWNTGHYLSHDALDQAGEDADIYDLTSGQWNGNYESGPYTAGFAQPAPGNYDNYTQWVYHSNDTLTLVKDRGPIVPGIMTMALSADGHEIEYRAPFKGFLKNAKGPSGQPNIALGKTIDVSFTLEASGELAAGSWASDTANPINHYFLGVPGDYNDDHKVDAADYVLWRTDPTTYGGAPTGYNTWRANYGAVASGSGNLSSGAVPEPASLMLVVLGPAGFWLIPRRKRGQNYL